MLIGYKLLNFLVKIGVNSGNGSAKINKKIEKKYVEQFFILPLFFCYLAMKFNLI